MRALRLLVLIGAVVGGYVSLPVATASARPLTSTPLAAPAATGPTEDYMRSRRSRYRYYAYRPYRVYYARRPVYRRVYYVARPVYRRVYYAPYPWYHRPRTVCWVKYSYWGVRRVCTTRW